MPWIIGSNTPPDTHDDKAKHALVIGDEMIAELRAAQDVVLCTPMYNFNIPAKLKAYIDHVVRSGQTFKINADQSVSGLLTGKRLTVLVSGAGEYEPGSAMEKLDHLTPYLTFVFGFVGMTDTRFVRCGSAWKVDKKMETLEAHVQPVLPKVVAAVSQ